MTIIAKTAKDAQLQIESGATFYDFEAGTNSGDNKKFTFTGSYFSMLEDDGFGVSRQPVVRLDGLKTGGNITPAVSASNNMVDVAALTCFLAGVDTSVAAATDKSVTRGSVNGYRQNSITVNSSGAITVVAGTESTAFSTTRGAAGGPPFVPVGSIEIGLVKLTSTTAAPVLASEIIFDPERAYLPGYELILNEAAVKFLSALPLIHTASVPRAVYCKHYDPTFVTLTGISNMAAPDVSESATDEITYDGIATSINRSSRNTGSFDALLSGLPGDTILQHANGIRVIKFFPDKFRAEHQLMWGSYSMARTYPADATMKAACTLIAITNVIEKSS